MDEHICTVVNCVTPMLTELQVFSGTTLVGIRETYGWNRRSAQVPPNGRRLMTAARHPALWLRPGGDAGRRSRAGDEVVLPGHCCASISAEWFSGALRLRCTLVQVGSCLIGVQRGETQWH